MIFSLLFIFVFIFIGLYWNLFLFRVTIFGETNLKLKKKRIF